MSRSSYRQTYEKISAPFRASENAMHMVRLTDHILTYMMYVLYPVLLVILFVTHDAHLLKAVLIPGTGFVLVTLIRRLINRPRPYAAYQIPAIIHKDKQGESMPSRHAFSAAVISMAFYAVYPAAGIILLVLSALECVIRVIGGVHYPEDVIIGYLAGVIMGMFI